MWIGVYGLGAYKRNTLESYLVANRNVGAWHGAFSIAVSWAWAPAIFLATQISYEKGIPGFFWFAVPNALCLVALGYLARRALDIFPKGYTFPEFISARFGSGVHILYVLIFLLYQLYAIAVNTLVAGQMIDALTPFSATTGVLFLAATALSYTIVKGLKASMITDAIQLFMIVGFGFILVPFIVWKFGGWESIAGGFGGVSGNYRSLFNTEVAYAFGIATTIGLFSGAFSDQSQWQRAMAVRKQSVKKAFVLGGAIFFFIPLIFSLLGFLAANPSIASSLESVRPEMVGIALAQSVLSSWAMMGFGVIILAGLCSPLDSAFSAASSLIAIDIYKARWNPDASDGELLRISRIAMFGSAILGIAIALIPGITLLHLFLIGETLGSTILFPTIASLWFPSIKSKGVFAGILCALCIAFPLSIYGNFAGNTNLIVLSALGMPLISTLVSVCYSKVFYRG